MSVQTKIEDEVSGIEFFVFVILIENTQFGAYGPVIIGATFSNQQNLLKLRLMFAKEGGVTNVMQGSITVTKNDLVAVEDAAHAQISLTV